MFPLGTVLFPSLYLPLHVFEPRYRELVRTCLDGDGCFGVTLIERGSEVGGGDVRTMVGTMAQIVEAAEMPDGRWALGAVGTHRIRVVRWLEDDPFPRAEIEPWPDEPVDDSGPSTPTRQASSRASSRGCGGCWPCAAELGDSVAPATLELADDARAGQLPGLGGGAARARGPTGAARGSASTSSRLSRLDALLADVEVDLGRQLDLDGRDDPPRGEPG